MSDASVVAIGKDLDYAISLLEKDEVIGVPMETFYGLAANAFSEKAIERVFRIKQRSKTNPLIVHVDRLAEVKALVRYMPGIAEELLMKFSPGPLTLLLPKNCILPSVINAGRIGIAIHIPSDPLTLELLRKIEFPIVAPSARYFRSPLPLTPGDVAHYFPHTLPYILDGGVCGVGGKSTVVGFDANGNPIIYRTGVISADEIAKIAGKVAVKG